MLEMRPDCELCGRDLLPGDDALICSFECTFCTGHALTACPNCGGDLQRRPTRPEPMLTKYPASVVRKYAA
ncbi:DUF1272 domain-containing protein [Sphingomonas antarctica]|uniref:DUF1272 domain-containing protein n=1 Tax=Sphingomonas antarctica TaxID=2040274 RepID=UPI0039EA0253